MMNNECSIRTQPFHKNVSFMLFIYWAVLVVWQNIGGAEARSSIDIVIKVGLLLYFISFFFLRIKTLSKNIVYFVLLIFPFLLTFFGEKQINFNIIISYFFPIVFIFCVYCIGNNFTVTKKHLTAFCKCVILVDVCSAVYALIFCQDQFVSALTVSNAYGNELTSFFISSHEYGMYLVYGIASCLICLYYNKGGKIRKKIPYLLAILLFAPNLILTFSRTSIFAFLILLIIYILFSKSKALKFAAALSVVGVAVLIWQVPILNNFVFKIVLKDNNMAGRNVLMELALKYFRDGTIIEKHFGHGIMASRGFFVDKTEHGSVHNAYLQILLYFGAIMLVALLIFLFTQCIACIKEMKVNRFMGAIHLGIVASAAAMMFTNTSILFMSPIDSFFLTMYAIVIPKYVRNAIKRDCF